MWNDASSGATVFVITFNMRLRKTNTYYEFAYKTNCIQKNKYFISLNRKKLFKEINIKQNLSLIHWAIIFQTMYPLNFPFFLSINSLFPTHLFLHMSSMPINFSWETVYSFYRKCLAKGSLSNLSLSTCVWQCYH